MVKQPVQNDEFAQLEMLVLNKIQLQIFFVFSSLKRSEIESTFLSRDTGSSMPLRPAVGLKGRCHGRRYTPPRDFKDSLVTYDLRNVARALTTTTISQIESHTLRVQREKTGPPTSRTSKASPAQSNGTRELEFIWHFVIETPSFFPNACSKQRSIVVCFSNCSDLGRLIHGVISGSPKNNSCSKTGQFKLTPLYQATTTSGRVWCAAHHHLVCLRGCHLGPWNFCSSWHCFPLHPISFSLPSSWQLTDHSLLNLNASMSIPKFKKVVNWCVFGIERRHPSLGNNFAGHCMQHFVSACRAVARW